MPFTHVAILQAILRAKLAQHGHKKTRALRGGLSNEANSQLVSLPKVLVVCAGSEALRLSVCTQLLGKCFGTLLT